MLVKVHSKIIMKLGFYICVNPIYLVYTTKQCYEVYVF